MCIASCYALFNSLINPTVLKRGIPKGDAAFCVGAPMTHKPARKIAAALTSMPWAMTEDYLRLMLSIARRENVDIETVERTMGRKLDNTRTVQQRGDVAIIPVTGPIFRYANLFSAVSGATSIQTLAIDFNAALNNPDVRAILLNIDSPGGEANGVAEFAEMVYRARGVKPIWAYVGGAGASAAYWIASTADEIVAHETALLGSIGVVVAVPNGADESEIEFVSSQSPRKRPDPATEEGRSDIQYIIDSLAQTFVETVARNRGVSTDTVLSDFGQGSLLVGKDAVAAKLADRLGAYEQTLAELSAKGAQSQTERMQAGAQYQRAIVEKMTAKGLIPPPLLSGSSQASILAPGGARRHIPTQLKEQHTMPDDIQEQAPVQPPPMPPVGDAAMQAQINAYVAQMEARYQAQQDAAFQRAQQEFERRIAEMEARRQIEAFAQDATTGSLRRPHALPCTADELTALLAETPIGVRAKWQTLITRTLDAGLISFEEIGSQAGDESYDVAAAWQAAIKTKMDTGSTRSAAIEAIKKEQPALFREYNESGATYTRKGGK